MTVFLSHASAEQAVITRLCAALEARGIECWMAPRDVAPGSDYAEAILDAIDRSEVFLLAISAASARSAHVRRELERADDRGVRVLPVRLEAMEPQGWMDYFLGGVQWIDAFPAPVEDHVGKVAAAIERRVVRPPVEVATGADRRSGRRWLVPSAAAAGLLIAVGLVVALTRGGGEDDGDETRGPSTETTDGNRSGLTVLASEDGTLSFFAPVDWTLRTFEGPEVPTGPPGEDLVAIPPDSFDQYNADIASNRLTTPAMYVSYRGQLPDGLAPAAHARERLGQIAELANCSYDGVREAELSPFDGSVTGVGRIGTCTRDGQDPLITIESVVVDEAGTTVVAFGSYDGETKAAVLTGFSTLCTGEGCGQRTVDQELPTCSGDDPVVCTDDVRLELGPPVRTGGDTAVPP